MHRLLTPKVMPPLLGFFACEQPHGAGIANNTIDRREDVASRLNEYKQSVVRLLPTVISLLFIKAST
jgi:hypothetical protein